MLMEASHAADSAPQVRNCPSRAISFVQKADVPLLDLAMREAVQLAQTSGVLKAVDGFYPKTKVRFKTGSGAFFCGGNQKEITKN